jgi:hypothetical protein
MGFFVFVYWIFFRRRLDLPYFALLALFSAFYIILRSPLANYYRGPFTYIMADTSWFVFMASAMAFLRHKFNIHNWSMRVFNFVFAYIPVFIMLALIKPLYYSNLVLPVQIMVLLIPFILVGNIFYYLNTLNKVEGIIVLITALIITVSSSVDVLGAINVIDRLDVDLGVYSLFIMAVCFAFLLCFDFLSFNATLSLEKSRYELEKSQMAHLEAEFKKMVEGWQFEKIKNGLTLEHSMPVQRNEACILNFQLLTAHGAGLGDEQIFFQTLLKKCRELVHEAAQDAVQEGAKGYSLKVSGYGFLVSVGFPLPCGSDIFENALRLAESFVGAFKKTTEELAPPQKLSCAVAVTYGQVTGYFPALGMRFYDLYGEPVVNAHHFHTLRSIFVAEKKMPHEPAIIVQHAVFEKLPSELKTAFAKLALAASSPGVGNAERFFYFRPA